MNLSLFERRKDLEKLSCQVLLQVDHQTWNILIYYKIVTRFIWYWLGPRSTDLCNYYCLTFIAQELLNFPWIFGALWISNKYNHTATLTALWMNTMITTLHKRVKEFLQQFCYINLKSLWISYSICLKTFDFSKPRKEKKILRAQEITLLF